MSINIPLSILVRVSARFESPGIRCIASQLCNYISTRVYDLMRIGRLLSVYAARNVYSFKVTPCFNVLCSVLSNLSHNRPTKLRDKFLIKHNAHFVHECSVVSISWQIEASCQNTSLKAPYCKNADQYKKPDRRLASLYVCHITLIGVPSIRWQKNMRHKVREFRRSRRLHCSELYKRSSIAGETAGK